MASLLLIEGLLDTKGPRGSEDRKFLKAWRQQWTRFSVVYPSGRREPYLVLSLSQSSSAVSNKEIKLSRDGLRLFRCRSRSRPYRTWAITSANKVVLYLAAESEIQAQNWMQAVRDGLWPPCFSFQVLTACSYEVSLVDDDNTFMAGLLGVYGRFVLTSEDVISLMHPHWGSTLLEISLDNIIDVLFIREAEISPAGVFSIILKRTQGSNMNDLQFFCNTAKDAIQWILSKLYARRESFTSAGSRKSRENRVSFSISNTCVSTQTNSFKNKDCPKTKSSINEHLVSSQANNQSKNVSDSLNTVSLDSEYGNLKPLHANISQSENKKLSFDEIINESKTNSLKNTTEEIFFEHSNSHYFHAFKNDGKNDLVNIISNENIYENILNERTLDGEESIKSFDTIDNLNILRNKNVDQKELNNSSNLESNDLPAKSSTIVPVEYAVVNKPRLEKFREISIKDILPTNINNDDNYVSESDRLQKPEVFNSTEFFKSNITFRAFASGNRLSDVIKTDEGEKDMSNCTTKVNCDSKCAEYSHLSDNSYSTINKNASNSTKSMQYSINESFSYQRNSTKENNAFLNLPKTVLDADLNSLNSENKGKRNSSSSEEENENFLSVVREFDELKMNDQIYENILERKGTIYEEIDEPDEEFSNPSLNAPELPKRPDNLEIPESLRLHKLSRNIQNTLEVMEDKQSQKVLHRPKFIKEIKDVNRIMRLSPNQEQAKEPFIVESKLKIDTTNEAVLTSYNPKTNT